MSPRMIRWNARSWRDRSAVIRVLSRPDVRALSGAASVRRRRGLLEVVLTERVEVRAPHEDLRRDLARHVLQEVLRHVGEIRVEVRIVGRDAHAVSPDEAGGGLDLRLASFDR